MVDDAVKNTKCIIFFIALIFTAGCCNALVPSRNIKIPPYIVEYYHYDDPEMPTHDEEESEGWYGHKWDNEFQMRFKIARVEESGVYFYRLVYRASNPLKEEVTLFDQNIELVDIGSNVVIEQVKCWNWQKVSYPCNVAKIVPGDEGIKEIRFGYSIDERYARSLRVRISGLSFEEGKVMINFYAKNPEDSL